MKLFVVLVVVAFVCVHAQSDDIVRKIEEKKKKAEENIKFCVNEVGVDTEVAKKLAFGDFSVRDEQAQCFVDCFFRRAGFMNDAGVPQRDVIISKLSSGGKNEALEKLVDECIKIEAGNKCETAYKIYECYWTAKVTAARKI